VPGLLRDEYPAIRMNRAALEQSVNRNRERHLADWKTLLAYPTVSADPAHDNDCVNCAQWLAHRLERLGFDSHLLPTLAKPVVFAQRQGSAGKPTVLLYGHYDVQPVDPLDQWKSPPFEPTMVGERLYARGASDNKGPVAYTLSALETLLQSGIPLPALKVILEGEEESSSAGISAALPSWRDRLRADILLVADAGTVKPGVPTIIMGLRGIVFVSFTLSGAHRDLHSGMHGGAAPNPAEGMAHLLAGLHAPDGRISVEGFYDSVTEPTKDERALANAVAMDPAEYRAQTGVAPVAGELGYTPAERIGFRPSMDVNGVHAGYGGPGSKTIIPAVASAKLSARLVPGQDPRQHLDALVRHIEHNVPPGLRLEITEKKIGGPALRVRPGSPAIRLAGDVLSDVFDATVAYRWEGGSLPILTELAAISGAEPLIVGMGSEDDNIHAPNESFSLDQFRQGYLFTGLFLSRL
jgi:acetylornithine deacetylase/succinyl-diaminopimelate desuccinylase-like protein